MKKLDRHEFHEELWMSEDFIDIISDDFIDRNDDFAKELSFELWRQYDLKYNGVDPVSFRTMKKIFEIMFSNLGKYNPDTKRLRPLSDRGR